MSATPGSAVHTAFDPPAELREERAAPAGTAVLAWMGSGAVIALALIVTLHFTSDPAAPSGATELGGAIGVGTIAGMTLAGALAVRVERALSASRPAVRDARGELARPLHAGLWAVPLGLAVPALMVLGVVVSVSAQSLLPAVLFATGGFAVVWSARRLLSTHRLTGALEDLEAGDVMSARQRLLDLEAGWTATRAARVTARLNLGLLALSEGELDGAARWYEGVRSGGGSAIAQAGLALVRVLQDRLEDADRALHAAMLDPRAAGAQAQIDAVRLLFVLRTDGASAARSLGEQLDHEESGALFRGLLALIRLRTGDLAGARALVDGQGSAALEESGWRQVIPEIAELLAAPELA